MENHEECARLQIKTDPEAVKRQAYWAGITPGMRVLDVGSGAGFTTKALADLVGLDGHVTGLDFSQERLEESRKRHPDRNINFVHHDIRTPYYSDEPYDAVFVRFLLEYFHKEQTTIVANCLASLKIGGIACLADSDNNSLTHYGPTYTERLQTTLADIMSRLERDFDFDAYAGRRLYGHLVGLGYENVACTVEPHHLIYGRVEEKDAYNWTRKLELTAIKSGCTFNAYRTPEFAHYNEPYDAFAEEFRSYFFHPGRFCFTPIVICRGKKPRKDFL